MGYVRICDLCGKPLHETGIVLKFKVKKRWYAPRGDTGWETIECHNACVEKLYEAVKQEAEG